MDLQQLLEAAVHRADLTTVDQHFVANGIHGAQGIVNLKAALVALANVADFEPTLRSTYQFHPTPSVGIKPIKKNLEFAKYLRNKFVGHIHPQLIEKAIEWQPTLRKLVSKLHDPNATFMINLWLLETAINSYVDGSGNHKFFESETDLLYPPDCRRFLSFLEITVRGALEYLTLLIEYWAPTLGTPGGMSIDLELAIKAGKTDFKFLTQ